MLLKDPAGRCGSALIESTESTPILKFVRIYPEPDHSAEEQIAHLDLSSAMTLGAGNHAYVFQGLFRPPSTLSIASRTGEATVAVKVPFNHAEHRAMLHVEARTYASLPKYLSEDWSGYHHLTEMKSYTKTGVVPINAVVPRYYGTYALDDQTSNIKRPVFSLFEDCGRQIRSHSLDEADRFKLLLFVFTLLTSKSTEYR